MQNLTQTVRAILISAAALCVWESQAAEPAPNCGPEKAVTTDMSEGVYQDVQSAMELIASKKYDEAIQKLQKIANKGSDYEKAVVNYNLGFAYSSKDDHKGATQAFAKALSFNALPRAQREQLQYNLGQLYIVISQFDEGIKTLKEYISTSCSNVPAEAHIFLANALTERKRYDEALPQIDLALSKAKEPKELWLQMKLAISFEQKNYKGCAEALVQLIGMVPAKPEYWKQLSSVFYEMKRDAESVAALALAERQGFIDKPNEVRNLYSVYMVMELPYKAGLLMESAIEKGRVPADEANYEALADAWINARESNRAETVLKKLAGMSDKGEYYFKLGAMYGDEERWKDSKEMLAKAIGKGGLKRTGEAWMRLAVAEHGLKNTQGAIAALQKAIGFDETRRQAGEWLRHLSGQVASQQSTEAASNAPT
jgi:tetratricopeptide (TPR) repeat protein